MLLVGVLKTAKSLLIEQFIIQALCGLPNEMLQQSVCESIFVFIGARDDRENKKY